MTTERSKSAKIQADCQERIWPTAILRLPLIVVSDRIFAIFFRTNARNSSGAFIRQRCQARHLAAFRHSSRRPGISYPSTSHQPFISYPFAWFPSRSPGSNANIPEMRCRQSDLPPAFSSKPSGNWIPFFFTHATLVKSCAMSCSGPGGVKGVRASTSSKINT